ncbi:hypothetical protein [Streptomyces antimycoticus]|uniref:hypothetical protein n=1 Tax=Streptomyces antimycoticus TaxID=68175 RepID=UPI0038707481|nr:hypothetical protein OG751_23135 [Streptomyces antimycoticus]
MTVELRKGEYKVWVRTRSVLDPYRLVSVEDVRPNHGGHLFTWDHLYESSGCTFCGAWEVSPEKQAPCDQAHQLVELNAQRRKRMEKDAVGPPVFVPLDEPYGRTKVRLLVGLRAATPMPVTPMPVRPQEALA